MQKETEDVEVLHWPCSNQMDQCLSDLPLALEQL